MGKFRHTLRRWRSAILGGEKDEVAPRYRPPEPQPANEPTDEPQIPDVEPFSDPATATICGTWKDLPQELFIHIMSMLGNDLQSLKACSLTCRAMFVSTRHIIHRRICLTSEKNWELLTVPERQRYIRGERQGLAIRVLSEIAALGLLQYARHLFIDVNQNFSPTHLQPFNQHFQCFDRVRELTIHWLHTPDFLEDFDTYFANFVPTLRSLHLELPAGDTRDILDFVCRFPHLDDLGLRMPIGDFHGQGTWKSESLPVVENMPPFRGALKLRWVTGWCSYLPLQLFSLPGKRRFRFLDFRDCKFEAEQPIIDACSGTLESVSTTWKRFDMKGLPMNLVDAAKLRSFTLRVDFDTPRQPYEVLSQTLSTITSPFFSEFVMEVATVIGTGEMSHNAWRWWETWSELDKVFERIDIERGFRVVVRAKDMGREPNFTAQVENRLPLMAARKGIVFEIGPFPER